MLIGICGAKCAGKNTVAQYLIDHHGFKKLHLEAPSTGTGAEDMTMNGTLDGSPSNSQQANSSGSSRQSPEPPTPNHYGYGPLPIQFRSARSTKPSHTFSSAEDLLSFVTKNWRSRWVTTSIPSEAALDLFSRRPFFILLSVDAPITTRWRRYQHRTGNNTSLEDFVAESDADLFSPDSGIMPLISRAVLHILNTSSDLAHLYGALGKLDLTNQDRLRPSWDSYFMQLASLAAQRCNCMKRAVGAVLVGKERRVISTGYNGTPRNLLNCGEGGCPRCNSGESSGVSLATCLCLHAEENALLEAGRERIREGSILYCNTCPCLTCSIKIVQVGISEVVYNQGYSMDGKAAEVFKNAGVKLRQFSPPAKGLIHLEKTELYN